MTLWEGHRIRLHNIGGACAWCGPGGCPSCPTTHLAQVASVASQVQPLEELASLTKLARLANPISRVARQKKNPPHFRSKWRIQPPPGFSLGMLAMKTRAFDVILHNPMDDYGFWSPKKQDVKSCISSIESYITQVPSI